MLGPLRVSCSTNSADGYSRTYYRQDPLPVDQLPASIQCSDRSNKGHWTDYKLPRDAISKRYKYITLSLSLSLSILTAIFPGGPGLASTRMSPFWIVLVQRMMYVVVTTGAMMYKAPVKSSPSTNQHSVFYRSDVHPVTQPTVSKHIHNYITQLCNRK